ncbi:hypothetical protein BDR26DRAFT_938581 [Obelidium mucronatum]|nr:hypothetical protein BDR26DRAFT_938581 [Obelidium mucronatum]
MDVSESASIVQLMEFRRKWQALVERIKAAELQPQSNSKYFEAAASNLAQLAVVGDSDALWVLHEDPTQSPISDPYFRYCAGVNIFSVLGRADSAKLWLTMAAEGYIADACLKIAEIIWSSSCRKSFAEALECLIKSVAILDLGYGKGGMDGYLTKVNRDEVCLLIAECYSYGVGVESNVSKSLEWLEKSWNGNMAEQSMLRSIFVGDKKTDVQRKAAKLLGVWYSTGVPPSIPILLDQHLLDETRIVATLSNVDLAKAQVWGKRSL